MKDKIFKLRNGKDYYILEEILHNSKKYALAVECNLDKDEINEDELVVMEVKIVDCKLIVDEIYDDSVAEEVVMIFKNKIQNSND